MAANWRRGAWWDMSPDLSSAPGSQSVGDCAAAASQGQGTGQSELSGAAGFQTKPEGGKEEVGTNASGQALRLMIARLLIIRLRFAVFQVVDASVRLLRGIYQLGIREIDDVEETIIEAFLVRRASRR